MNLSWELLDDLTRLYGDPFYLVDLQRFKTNYQEFLAAFRSIYPKSQIAYSYKTNYTPRLCQIVNSLGGYAEVVSRMEYELAVRIGAPPRRIIFNGPLKRTEDIEQALLAGAMVNLDGGYEVAVVEQVAKRAPHTRIRVGLRCNFDAGGNIVSRFGFDVARPEFHAAITRLRRLDNCQIGGLHCHFLTPLRSAESYERIARQMLEVADAHFGAEHLQFIDLGGGFFSKMNEDLKRQFAHPIPNYQEYGEAIASTFAARFGQGAGPELILEPGIALTADIMKLVAQAIDIKTIGARTVALLSSSIYEIKPTLSSRNLPISVVKQPERQESNPAIRKMDLVGYTCMEGDCLYQGFAGRLTPGDRVVFDNVGAYTNVLKPPFINPAPAMVGWDATSGQFELIRRREEMVDVFSTYVF
jgi:diaminopimelate decarboxylase